MKKLKLTTLATVVSLASFCTVAAPQDEGFSIHAGYSAMTGELSDRMSDSSTLNVDLAYTFDNGFILGARYAPELVSGEFSPSAKDPEVKASVVHSIESNGYGAYIGYQDISGFRSSIGVMFVETKIEQSKDSSLGYMASVGYLTNHNISLDLTATYLNLGNFTKNAFNDGTSEGVSIGLNLGYKF
ncbi:hypothetical protein ACTTZI_004159 [Vibrio vulnificus]